MQKDNTNLYPASEAGTADGYDGSESGVEPDYAESVFDYSEEASDILFDMSDEQVLAALRYFTSTAQRTTMLTKTHSNDLEMIAQCLSDKEKDLEMTAKIGQSLLQRNKQLMVKIETMEDYLSQTTENAAQLQHDLQMKSKLVELYTQDDDIHSTSSSGSKEDRGVEDQEIVNLTNRCRKLEKDNQNLFSEALGLRQMTEEMEEKEETLVMDCIEQLASAKLQITQLTDEIALKFEDNLQQQMEISQLINMVVELQRKQKLLIVENGDLQEQLNESNENRENLQEQLHEMQVKFRETKELMVEHQEELKALKSRLDSADNPCDWLSDSGHSLTLQESLATEIEETVRRDLTTSLEKSKLQNRKLLDHVRYMNVKGSDTTSGRTSPASLWSLASDERSEGFDAVRRRQSAPAIGFVQVDSNRARKPTRKLQIVKPMEGSDTLNKWHHLASKNIKGGLNVSDEKRTSVENKPSFSMEDTNISIIHDDEPSVHEESSIDTSGEDDISPNLPPEIPKLEKEKTSSPKPRPVARPRVLSDLSTPQKKTIITRNSAALKSLRTGRSLLNSAQKGGRSQAEVIDMIATAMGKVNVKATTEKRILSSLNSPVSMDREITTPVRADYTDMPNVVKALNKAAQLNESEKGSELEHFPESQFRTEGVVSNNSTTSYDSGAEELNYSTAASIDCTSIPSTLTHTSSKTLESSLHSISGPLGLLNRADPSQPNTDIMNNLLRFSAVENTSNLSSKLVNEEDTTNINTEGQLGTLPINNNLSGISIDGHNSISSNESTDIHRNVAGGSLVGIMASSRRKSRPLVLGNLVGLDNENIKLPVEEGNLTIDEAELDIDVDDKTRTKLGDTTNDITQPTETTLDSIKKEGNNGIFGFFSSFLS